MGRRIGWLVVALGAPLAAATWLLVTLPFWAAGIGHAAGAPRLESIEAGVLLDALLYDGIVTGDRDEAVCLLNTGPAPVDLGGWTVSDRPDGGGVRLPAGVSLAAGQRLWLAWDGAAFAHSFGHLPDWQVIAGAPGVPLLEGAWPGFANAGDEAILRDAAGALVDALVYEGGDAGISGWAGPAIAPYRLGSNGGIAGQVLYRKRDQRDGRPVPDTNRAADWAQDPDDPIDGRRVRYPGWDLDAFFFPARITETARLTVAVAPDNAYDALIAFLASAEERIEIEALTLEHLGIGEALAAAAARGVTVTVLLEGGPVGGISDQERHICQQLASAGGACWFMVTDADADVADRYGYLHAKIVLVDRRRVAVSSENLSPNSLPDDDKADGTTGRRGVVLFTDAPAVAAHIGALFAADFEPRSPRRPNGHTDLRRWSLTETHYGPPPPGFVPITVTGGVSYAVRYPSPAVFAGAFAFEVLQSPENSLRTQGGLLGLLAQAGPGDRVLVQQLHEPPHWGGSDGDPGTDPNLRLEAYLAAARRGATVRLLLDSFLDEPGSSTGNARTCERARIVARDEGLDLECALANPAGLGIHNKMILAWIGGHGWVHVGSVNGTEQASKGNREVALQVQSDAMYAWLAELFLRDWPYRQWLPLALSRYRGAAAHALISEVLYDPTGPDDAEFVELVNPGNTVLDIGGFALGDAALITDFEDVRRFPPGTRLPPGAGLVVAANALAFQAMFARLPAFELQDTHPTVPELIDDPAWGSPEASFRLGNGGDEVILRDAQDRIVDAVVYGAGTLPGLIACPLVPHGHSLARTPFWRDSDDCAADFRDSFPPGPGRFP